MPDQLSEKQITTLWFVRLRWAAILLMLLIILVSDFIGHLRIPLLPNLIVIGIAALYNLIYPSMIKRWRWFSENTFFTFLRSSADMALITLVIYFTGGVESPLKLFYLIELSATAVAGMEVIAYLLSIVAAGLYYLSCSLEAALLIPHYRLIDQPGTLYLNNNYAFSKSLALLFSAWVLVYIISFLANKLRQKQKEIAALSDAKYDFMNIVMHEAKSPLTSIIGYTDLLANQNFGPIPESQKEPLAVIKRQSQRILNMTNDLLSLARLEAGKTKIEKKLASLADIASRAIEELSPLANAKKLTISTDFMPDTPTVPLDENKIIEVFINLLSNAIKFSNDGSRIFMSIAPIGKEVVVSIRDEGLGIDPADLPHIFEKFFRANQESADRKGTGLGLPLCKSLIEAHGGRIWVVSPGPGKGTTAIFALPIQS